jgi:hypothetical protein
MNVCAFNERAQKRQSRVRRSKITGSVMQRSDLILGVRICNIHAVKACGGLLVSLCQNQRQPRDLVNLQRYREKHGERDSNSMEFAERYTCSHMSHLHAKLWRVTESPARLAGDLQGKVYSWLIVVRRICSCLFCQGLAI